ncbi:MAG: hypothetical protein QG657_2868, partial [Acidobacteriota bacterium]|nr:hypothetical protein [Acidobacteriota bacterium]
MTRKNKTDSAEYELKRQKNTILLILINLISTLIWPLKVNSLPDDGIEFKHISIKEGLSQGSINCIIQDSRGFMLFGTQAGLNRYDGHNFKIYSHEANKKWSLSHNLAISIYKDSKETIWIGTYGGGLNRYDSKTEKFINHNNNPDQFKGLELQNVWAICEDNTGALWIGTDNGLFISNPEKNHFNRFEDQPVTLPLKVRAIYKDREGTLWVGGDSGLFKYSNDTGKFQHYPIVSGNPLYNEVTMIIEDQAGTLWIGTVGGIYTFDRKKEIFEPYPGQSLTDKFINVIYEDMDSTIWIGTRADGLYRLNLKSGKIKPFKSIPNDTTSLSSNNISTIYQDRDGFMWIGTAGKGINTFDPGFKRFTLYNNEPDNPSSLNNNEIRGISEGKDGMIWIGTNGGGINRFDPNSKTFEHYEIKPGESPNPRRNYVNTIFMDYEGKLWVGTVRAGLYIFDPKNGKFAQFQNNYKDPDESIVELYEDSQKYLWIGTLDNGLTVIDQSRKKFKNFKYNSSDPKSLSNNKVYALREDNKGNLWIGTGSGGLNKLELEKFAFDENEEIFYRFQPDPTKSERISDNFISAIYQDNKGRLWIGTASGGLNRLINERDKSFEVYTTKQGLPDNTSYDILEDSKGYLWLSTNKGLSRFNPGREEFRNYSENDGLQGYEFTRRSACKSRTGALYFGGFNGFNVFNPDEIKDISSPPPPIVITSFKKLNQDVKLEPSISERHELKLYYKDSFISFGFAALSFSEPGNNQYAYKLEPINNDWIYLGNKHDIDFNNLEPGNYSFRVKGANNRGVWNEQGASLKIIVIPPFWVTWWFRVLLFLALLSGIAGFVKIRTTQIKKQNKKLEEFVLERTNEINQQKEELREANVSLKNEIKVRRKAEMALMESQERYRTLVETSPDAIILSDIHDGRIIMTNRQSAALCGYTSVEDMHAHVNTFFELMNENSSNLAHKNVEKIKKQNISRNTEYTLLSKDDKLIAVEISTSLVEGADGNPRYFLSIIRDIRERKEAEQKETLQRERLIQADRMVSLGRLVSGVAHELNNPASSIKMNSEIFDRVWKDVIPILDEYYKRNSQFSLAHIPYTDAKSRLEDLIIGSMESAQRIEKIIKDLKDFSRPGDASTREPIHIDKVIQSSVNLTQNLLKKCTKHFSLQFAENLPDIMGNSTKLEQVFINLIQNACQALPDSTSGISISTAFSKENNQVVVQVKDEGVGIEEKDLKYITEPFFTTRRDQGGTGLGLSISLQIIQDH